MIASRAPLLVVVSTILVLAATGNLLSWTPIVIAVQVGAVVFAVWARRTFRAGAFRVEAAPAGHRLMREGPYRLVRHPMYGAVIVLIWSGILSHAALWTVALGAAVTVMVVVRIRVEERLLRTQYAEYDDYARHTTALIPFVV